MNSKDFSRSSRIPQNNEENPKFAGRKRKNTTSVVESSKIQKKVDVDKKTDKYCWICHQLGHDSICNLCPRVYHSKCLKKRHLQFNASGSCGECQAQFVSEGNVTPSIHKYSLTELLELVMQEALKENVTKNNQRLQPEFQSAKNKFWKHFETWPENSNLCQIMDLSTLVNKMEKKSFLTTAEFFSDVKWIYHNCYILHGVDSDITITALKLEKNFKQELLDLEACGECYFITHLKEDFHSNFFTRVCEDPHDIVWAKLRGSPYWPAKCMRIYNGHADVRFFGTHDKSFIQLNQCFLISQKSPNNREIKQSKYLDAIAELSDYVSNYCVIYYSFPYYPYRTPLVDSNAIIPKKSNKKDQQRKSLSGKQLNDSCLSEDISDSSELVKEMGNPSHAPINPIKEILSESNELVKEIGTPSDQPINSNKEILSESNELVKVNAILNNSGMAHAFSQHLSSNRLHLQELYKKCLDFELKFLQIWLSLNETKHDESSILMFLKVYDNIIKGNEACKEESVCPKHEKDSLGIQEEFLKQEKSLKKENELLQHTNENFQVQFEDFNLQKVNAEKIMAFMNVNGENLKFDTPQLETLQSLHDSILKKIDTLKENLYESKNALLEKDNELEKSKKRVLQLEEQLKSALETTSCSSRECQTALSDLPDNQMFTLKELKKSSEEQGCNKHSNLMKECAMILPTTVISSAVPSTAMSSNYVPQQSNNSPNSNSSRKLRRRKKNS